jgi:hypothetical protein
MPTSHASPKQPEGAVGFTERRKGPQDILQEKVKICHINICIVPTLVLEDVKDSWK